MLLVYLLNSEQKQAHRMFHSVTPNMVILPIYGIASPRGGVKTIDIGILDC